EVCDECLAKLPPDSWVEITEEELQQLEYIDDFEPREDIPTWEYEVLKLKSDSIESVVEYNKTLLNGMGEKGWELVRITSMGDSESDSFGVFKRSWSDKIED
ncbi:MAG: DUF4177 domain-containing protein, partial [SAR202 cluster bacterium]|nr:DUF4177 domain-containing protein [SAR202 cluster bacterium]